ncbi:MAG: hypothetical protein HYZ38_06645 [Mycobacterium sp.]|nr:hypothetical protein [Mycobacterium sp.]
MNPPVGVPRLRDYLRIVAGGWFVIVCATVLSGIAALCVQNFVKAPDYVAETRLFAIIPSDAGVFAAYEGDLASTFRNGNLYPALAKSTLVANRTIDDLHLSMSPAALAKMVTVNATPTTLSPYALPASAVLQLRVTGDDPEQAVAIANALSNNLAAVSRELEWVLPKPDSPVRYTGPGAELIRVDDAVTAQEVRPSWIKTVGTGAGVGLGFSVLLVLIVGLVRGRVLDKGQLNYVIAQATDREVPWNVR